MDEEIELSLEITSLLDSPEMLRCARLELSDRIELSPEDVEVTLEPLSKVTDSENELEERPERDSEPDSEPMAELEAWLELEL